MNAGIIEKQLEIPAEHEKNVYGQFDENVKKLERSLSVSLIARDGSLHIVGPENNVNAAESVLRHLVELSAQGNEINAQQFNYMLAMAMEEKGSAVLELDRDCICHTINGRPVKPKTLGQKEYVDAIRNHMITFGLGPAGTGKTYLAMAMAITAFRNDEVGRIILTDRKSVV